MRQKRSSKIVSMRLSSQLLARIMAENGHNLRRMTNGSSLNTNEPNIQWGQKVLFSAERGVSGLVFALGRLSGENGTKKCYDPLFGWFGGSGFGGSLKMTEKLRLRPTWFWAVWAIWTISAQWVTTAMG
jgi:hypothetical protein